MDVIEYYILRMQTSLVQFLFNGTAKTNLAILAFLYCGDFVKNPTVGIKTNKFARVAFLFCVYDGITSV